MRKHRKYYQVQKAENGFGPKLHWSNDSVQAEIEYIPVSLKVSCEQPDLVS